MVEIKITGNTPAPAWRRAWWISSALRVIRDQLAGLTDKQGGLVGRLERAEKEARS